MSHYFAHCIICGATRAPAVTAFTTRHGRRSRHDHHHWHGGHGFPFLSGQRLAL